MTQVESYLIGPTSTFNGVVLCVDDDPIAQLLFQDVVTKANGYCRQAESLEVAITNVKREHFDLIILDRKLPDGDGLLLIDVVKRYQPDCKVVVISTLNESHDKILGIGLGATEYITKPVNPLELGHLVHNCLEDQSRLRRTRASAYTMNGTVFQPGSRSLKTPDCEIFLPPSESKLLETLLKSGGEPVSRDWLTQKVCGRGWSHGDRTVDVLVARLRRKLPKEAARIVTINRLGYVLMVTDAAI